MTEPPKNKSMGAKPSALRFLTQNLIQNKDPEGNDEIATHGNRGQIYTNFQIPADFGRRRKLEPMAADRFGGELGPYATIWILYFEEARKYDRELVKGRQKSLDTLLLSAVLFSAILTPLLTQSKYLLQQGPADTSQQRIELGFPVPEGATLPITMPSFEPSMIALWVDGLWFMSFGLSLSAASMAMLAKEWLTGYIAFRPHSSSPRMWALNHQSRLKGLEGWRVLQIIDLLPMLLHISLLLFAIGLGIYLWPWNLS